MTEVKILALKEFQKQINELEARQHIQIDENAEKMQAMEAKVAKLRAKNNLLGGRSDISKLEAAKDQVDALEKQLAEVQKKLNLVKLHL